MSSLRKRSNAAICAAVFHRKALHCGMLLLRITAGTLPFEVWNVRWYSLRTPHGYFLKHVVEPTSPGHVVEGSSVHFLSPVCKGLELNYFYFLVQFVKKEVP